MDSHIPKVLMVDQLWMWIVDDETIVTFFPGREADDHRGWSRDGDVRSRIYQDINGDFVSHPCVAHLTMYSVCSTDRWPMDRQINAMTLMILQL